MATPLNTRFSQGLLVVKRGAIGEFFEGGMVDMTDRQMTDDQGNPMFHDTPNARGEKRPMWEKVLTVRTIQSTMNAGLKDRTEVPSEGDLVRIILAKGAYRDWIESSRKFEEAMKRGIEVGDVVRMETTHADRYLAQKGKQPVLGTLTTMEQVKEWADMTAPPPGQNRKENLGWRGPTRIRPARDSEADMVAACEQARVELLNREAVHQANEQAAIATDLPPVGAAAAGGGGGDEFF